jgi:hypothetical protein
MGVAAKYGCSRPLLRFLRSTTPWRAASSARSWCSLEHTSAGPRRPNGSAVGSSSNMPRSLEGRVARAMAVLGVVPEAARPAGWWKASGSRALRGGRRRCNLGVRASTLPELHRKICVWSTGTFLFLLRFFPSRARFSSALETKEHQGAPHDLPAPPPRPRASETEKLPVPSRAGYSDSAFPSGRRGVQAD